MLLALSGLSPGLPGAPRLVVSTVRLVAGAPSYCEHRQEYPSRVWYSPEIDASKCTLHILSGTPGGFQCLQYIFLMLWCHFGEEGICLGGFDNAFPGVFLLQPSPFYAQKTQLPTSSLFGLQCEISCSVIAFTLLQRRKTLLWPFWPIQYQTHVRLFQLYPSSLACHSSRHDENLQEICFSI